MGLLDNPQALSMGLLGAGGSLLANSGPSPVPRGLLSGFGNALQGFTQGYQGSQDRERQNRLYELQLRGLEREDANSQDAIRRRDEMAAAVADMQFPPDIEMEIRNLARVDPEKALEKAYDYKVKTMGDGGASPPTGMRSNPDGTWVYDPAYIAGQERLRAAGRTSITNNLGSNGIDYGKPQDGLVWTRNPDGTIKLDERGAPVAIPYQGGKAYAEQQAGAAADVAQTESTTLKADVVLTDINRALKRIEGAPFYSPTAGLVGNILKDVGGTGAADVKALTDTVRANIGFDRLSKMREESPTGGALGQVTERELSQLQAVLGSIDQSQSQGQLIENLKRLKIIYSGILEKAGAYPNATKYGFGATPDAPSTQIEPGTIEDGWQFGGGDPADQNNWEYVGDGN